MTAPTLERIHELQQRVRRMEGVGITQELSLLPALSAVMTVRTGTVCSVDSPGLALALAAGPSQNGAWVGFAGMPEVGWEAASELGIDLDRTVAVPFPGEHWQSVTGALIDVVSVIIVRPPATIGDSQASRIAARLRQRGTVLIVDGAWPRAALRLTTLRSEWSGLSFGHGYLRGRQIRIQINSLAESPRLVSLDLGNGGLRLVPDRLPADDLGHVSAMVG